MTTAEREALAAWDRAVCAERAYRLELLHWQQNRIGEPFLLDALRRRNETRTYYLRQFFGATPNLVAFGR